mgnify:CR=1 FL=1
MTTAPGTPGRLAEPSAMPTAPTGDRLLREAPGKRIMQPERRPREAGGVRRPPVPDPGPIHRLFKAIKHNPLRRPLKSWHRIPLKPHGPNRLPRPTRRAPGRHRPAVADRQHGQAPDRRLSQPSQPNQPSQPRITRAGARRRHRQAEPAGAEATPHNPQPPVGRTGVSLSRAGALRQPAPPGQAGERVRQPKAKVMAGTIRHRLNRMQPGKLLQLRQPRQLHRRPSRSRPLNRLPDGHLRTRAHPDGAPQLLRRTPAAGANRPPIQEPRPRRRVRAGPEAEAAPGKEPVRQPHRPTAEPPGVVRPQRTWQVKVQGPGPRSPRHRQSNRPRRLQKRRPHKTPPAGQCRPPRPPAGEHPALTQAGPPALAGLRVREPRQQAAPVRPGGAQAPPQAARAGEIAPRQLRHHRHPRHRQHLRKRPVDGACRRRQRASLNRQDGVRRLRLNKLPDGRLPLRRLRQHRQQAAGEALRQLRRRQRQPPRKAAGVRRKIPTPGEAALRARKVARTGLYRPSRWRPVLSKRSRKPG